MKFLAKILTVIFTKFNEISLKFFLRLSSLNFFRPKEFPLIAYSKIFDRNDLPKLKSWTYKMMASDETLSKRLNEKRLNGLRSWEYGVLLNFLTFKKESSEWLVLDIGPGNSSFPFFISKMVKKLTTIDYEKPLEPPSKETLTLQKESGIENYYGSMLSLPFQKEYFDVVTCISCIEHLDDDGKGEQMEYQKFLQNVTLGLSEMMRVVKKGGYLYLTSDAYIPELVKEIDEWSKKRNPGNIIWSAFKYDDIQRVFLKTIADKGFEIIGNSGYFKDDLVNNRLRSTYRGRHFTTFSILAQKKN